MEGTLGGTFLCCHFSLMMLGRINAFTHEITRGSGGTFGFGKADIGVGAETEKIFFAGAGASITNQPSLGAVRPHA